MGYLLCRLVEGIKEMMCPRAWQREGGYEQQWLIMASSPSGSIVPGGQCFRLSFGSQSFTSLLPPPHPPAPHNPVAGTPVSSGSCRGQAMGQAARREAGGIRAALGPLTAKFMLESSPPGPQDVAFGDLVFKEVMHLNEV